MKRILVWAGYAIGAISVVYIALSIYVMLNPRPQSPNRPIEIYEREDAPRHGSLPRRLLFVTQA